MGENDALPSEQPEDYTADGPDVVRTYCPLPEGAIPLFAVEICEYVAEDGARGYVVRYPRNSPYSTVVGLMEMGKFQVLQELAESMYLTDEDEDDEPES